MKHFILFLTILLLSMIFNGLIAQTSKEKITLKIEDFVEDLENLKEVFGENKKIPSDYELQSLLALSRYPELKEEKIEFVYATGAYTMAARPKITSVFTWGRKKRTYQIFINTISHKGGLLLSEVPFNEQVGVIGHELAHILYYTKRSALRIILDGIAYSSKKFRSKFEKDTDIVAIHRGFGWQIYAFSNRVLSEKKIPEEYKKYKRKIYLSPEAVLDFIKGQDASSDSEENPEAVGF